MTPKLIILRWLAVAIAIASSASASAQTVEVFSTLGPGNAYDQNSGYTVGNVPPSLFFESAAQFTAQAGGILSEVDLGLTTQSNTSNVFPSVNVYLANDASGEPDNLSEILLGTVTPTQFFGSTNNSLVSLSSLSSLDISVAAGMTYWLVLKPAGSSSVSDVWNRSAPAISGAQDFSKDDTNWNNSDSTLAAFQIIAVPEPATWEILALGILMIPTAMRSKRRAIRNRSELHSSDRFS